MADAATTIEIRFLIVFLLESFDQPPRLAVETCSCRGRRVGIVAITSKPNFGWALPF
jgi:hypothetical protein